MELDKFFRCLFEPAEMTCFAKAPKDTSVYSLDRCNNPEFSFFSINALDSIDRTPTEGWHRSDIPRRADSNITSYRNILVEMDKMPLEDQAVYIAEIGLPYTTQVYSGSKSHHYIISLEVPLSDAKAYRILVERIYRAIGKDKVDKANKNPSRLSRMPGHIRKDTGKEQTLIYAGPRISLHRLEGWLKERGVDVVEASEWEHVPRFRRPKDFSSLWPSTRNFLMAGADENWNLSLFKAAADLCRNGWNVDEALDELSKITGHLDATDMKTVRSAYKNEEAQNGR